MSKAAVARAIRQRDRLVAILKRLDDRTIEDLERRGRFIAVPDGFRPAAGGGVSSSEVSRPTESAVVARLEVPPADPLGKTILGVFAALGAADVALSGVEHSLEVVRGYGAMAARASSLAGDCKCCERPVAGGAADPIRNGYCDACRKAYARWCEVNPVGEDPAGHRLRFDADRRAKLVELERLRQGKGLPPVECGHAHCREVASHTHWHEPAACPECVASSSGGQVAS